MYFLNSSDFSRYRALHGECSVIRPYNDGIDELRKEVLQNRRCMLYLLYERLCRGLCARRFQNKKLFPLPAPLPTDRNHLVRLSRNSAFHCAVISLTLQ